MLFGVESFRMNFPYSDAHRRFALVSPAPPTHLACLLSGYPGFVLKKVV